MTRRKGEYSKSRLDREFPHQVIVSADRCTGANSAVIESLCKTLTLGPRHHSVFHQDRWHLVYCFADAAHADHLRQTFGGETFDPKARKRGRDWHRLRSRSTSIPTTPNPSFFRPYRTVHRLHGCKCSALRRFPPTGLGLDGLRAARPDFANTKARECASILAVLDRFDDRTWNGV
jgi:hypothetical protein